MGIASGSLLVVGFLTPYAAAVAGLFGLGIGFSVLPHCTRTLFESSVSVVFAATILVAITILGPGAVSVDARMFGRREIIIPRNTSSCR